MFLRLILIISLVMLMFIKLSYAQNEKKVVLHLIDTYTKALRKDNREAIKEAWTNLNQHFEQNKDARTYVRDNYPNILKSYEWQSIALRSESVQRKFFGGLQETDVKISSKPIPGPRQRRLRSINDFGLRESNQRRFSNTKRVKRFPNREFTSNNDRVRRFSNRVRTSNQDRIRTRVRNRFTIR